MSAACSGPAYSAPVHVPAPSYSIEARLFVDGELVASPRLVVVERQPAEIVQASSLRHQEMRLKVVASDLAIEEPDGGILLKMEVAFQANGRNIRSTPQIVVQPGAESYIALADESQARDVHLKIVATKN